MYMYLQVLRTYHLYYGNIHVQLQKQMCIIIDCMDVQCIYNDMQHVNVNVHLV